MEAWKCRREWWRYFLSVLRAGASPPPPHMLANMRLSFVLSVERRAEKDGRNDLREIARRLRADWQMEDE